MPKIGTTIQQAVAVIVITIALLAMTPTVVDTVQGMKTTDRVITGEFLGDADNATTLFYFDYKPITSGSETIYQNTTEVSNYVYYTSSYIIGINFTSPPNSLNGNITADYTDTSGWHFTGYQGAILFLGLVPFIWVASILTACALGMFAIYKGGKGR